MKCSSLPFTSNTYCFKTLRIYPKAIAITVEQKGMRYLGKFTKSYSIFFCLTITDIIRNIYIHINKGFLYLPATVFKHGNDNIFFIQV